MSNERKLPVLLWPISCFDRRCENPLPVYSRWYWLDWDQLTPQQTKEILAIVEAKNSSDTPHKPVGFNETVITMSVESPNFDPHMLMYRRLFTEVPGNDVEAFCDDPTRQHRGFQTVSVSTEYFEDEKANPVSNYEMMQHISGQKFPIIVGDPKSVLRLGPVSAVNTNDWSIDKANTIAQFLDVVERIRTSDWYRSPRFITSLTHKAEESRLLEAEFPDDKDTMAVLAYFRQLHAKDKLVKKACDAYVAHAGDSRKRWWINERKQTFESLIKSSPAMPSGTNEKTRCQIIRMFMYGAGLLHSSSSRGDDAALDAFILQQGKHEAVMIFNLCLMDFFRIAATIHPVIHQDYQHWVNTDGLEAATRYKIPNLFEGFTSPPHGT